MSAPPRTPPASGTGGPAGQVDSPTSDSGAGPSKDKPEFLTPQPGKPLTFAASKKGKGRRWKHDQRLARVSDLLAACKPQRLILRECAAEWGVSETTVLGYIEEVYRTWAEQSEKLGADRRDHYREAMQEFYQAALAAGDTRSAIMALDRLAKLDGAYAPEKIAAVTQVIGTPEMVRDRITELLANPEVRERLKDIIKP